jgi:ABC-type dipeptide/oligopeptide/nickel transport system permease subunit
VLAARALGGLDRSIIFRHILPNTLMILALQVARLTMADVLRG